MTRIGTEDSIGYVGEPKQLARDSRGRYYVASSLIPGEIKVFDPRGAYLRHLATPGSGPGEVRGAPIVYVRPDDSVSVFDNGNARHTVYGPDLERAREARLPIEIRNVTWIPGGGFVAAGPSERDGTWTALVSITPDDSVAASFGGPDFPVRRSTVFLLWRQVALASDGGVWAVPTHADYRLKKFTRDGQLTAHFIREAAWFAPSGPDAIPQWRPGMTPPPAVITDLREDDDGRVWIMSLVASERWKDAYEVSASSPPGYLMFDSVLEVLDPDSGVVVARQRSDRYLLGFVQSHVYTYREDERGTPIVEVWTADLTGDRR